MYQRIYAEQKAPDVKLPGPKPAAAAGPDFDQNPILKMQQTHGNAAVTRMIASTQQVNRRSAAGSVQREIQRGRAAFIASLQPGDILLLRTSLSDLGEELANGEGMHVAAHAPTKGLQNLAGAFRGRPKNAETNTHAALYLGGGVAAEAVANGIQRTNINTAAFMQGSRGVSMYRCNDPALAAEVVNVATTWTGGAAPNLRYSYSGAAKTIFIPKKMSNSDARWIDNLAAQSAIPRPQVGGNPVEMFCSMFVTAVYQVAAINIANAGAGAGAAHQNARQVLSGPGYRSLNVDSKAMSPAALEVQLAGDAARPAGGAEDPAIPSVPPRDAAGRLMRLWSGPYNIQVGDVNT